MKSWFVIIMFLAYSCSPGKSQTSSTEGVVSNILTTEKIDKITGISLEMPGGRIEQHKIDELKTVNAGWVAMIPYGYCERDEAKVQFNFESRWWGESLNGTMDLIEMAQKTDLKVMLKPHVWVVGQGWPGNFELKTEEEWLIWESSYRDYILACANIADSFSVDLFCIGTEYRIAVVERTEFWRSLIKEIRDIYSGPITYAANWDNYQKVDFWDELDYIGIDAYFPLSKEARPSLEKLKSKWQPLQNKLGKLSEKHDKKIIFTEYGYKSVEYTNAGSWNYKDDTVKVSMPCQANAYKALYETVWQQDWMIGGFLWKWHCNNRPNPGGPKNNRYTPQGKLVMDVIRDCYGK